MNLKSYAMAKHTIPPNRHHQKKNIIEHKFRKYQLKSEV